LCIHVIGFPEEVTLIEFEGSILEEDQEQPREPEDPAGEGVSVYDLPEFSDHRPSSFLKDQGVF
jgi:hypothetical protein